MGELPKDYNGNLYFFYDTGKAQLYAVYNHPFHLIRKFWQNETQTVDFADTSMDAATWLYHQMADSEDFPKSNECLDDLIKDESNLDDLSLTYLGELATNVPGVIVGYADSADQMFSILYPYATPAACERAFQSANASEATTFRRK